ncbi:hypothetical protein RK989_05010 [Streptococcus pneumoniae]|nr:hypothetical protein [Streptococcus pneumoniae]MDS4870467.1 hypothetical protein [Streptococcus pneumoniae]
MKQKNYLVSNATVKISKQEIEAEKPASVEAWIISVKLKKVATDIYRFQKQKR